MTAGAVATGLGVGLAIVAYQTEQRVDERSRSLRMQEAEGAPASEIDRLEKDVHRQQTTLLTTAIGAGVLGVTGLTLLAIALFRRGSPSLTHHSPHLRPAPAFVVAF